MTERRNPNNIFEKIVKGEIPAKIVYQDDLVTAFRDINPQAPTHILIVPNEPFPDIGAVGEGDAALLARMFKVANDLAQSEGLADENGPLPDKGYRLVINTGEGAGQTVDHLHIHLLGGRPFHWPPG